METTPTKKTLGRLKIKMEKIENKSHLQVTFSKRRQGLFKKASELAVLCGVEVGIIVQSPADKIYTFEEPELGLESLLNRINSNAPPDRLKNTRRFGNSRQTYEEAMKHSGLESLINRIDSDSPSDGLKNIRRFNDGNSRQTYEEAMKGSGLDSPINRINSNSPSDGLNNTRPFDDDDGNSRQKYEEAMKALETEKEKLTMGGGLWWDAPIEGLDLHQLEEFLAALEFLRGNIERQITMI